MTLLDYMNQHYDEEITVYDTDYDIEIYFYGGEPEDDWDKAMQTIAAILEIKEVEQEPYGAFYSTGVTVNLSEIIGKSLDRIKQFFIDPDLDAIMYDIPNIFAGYVSEGWMKDFAETLAK